MAATLILMAWASHGIYGDHSQLITHQPLYLLKTDWSTEKMNYTFTLLSEADTTEIIILGRHHLLQYHTILNGNDS